MASPSARFIQWRATLNAAPGGASPELESVSVAYLPKNVEPRIDEIEITPANYKFPAGSAALPAGPSQSLTLPPLGKRAAEPDGGAESSAGKRFGNVDGGHAATLGLQAVAFTFSSARHA